MSRQESHFRAAGTYPRQESTYNSTFKALPPTERVFVNEEQKAQLSHSHFSLVTTKEAKTGLSEMRSQFVELDGTEQLKIDKAKNLKANITLGNDKQDYVSSNTAAYVPFDVNTDGKKTIPLQESHFKLGHDKDEFLSSNKSTFQGYDPQNFPELKKYMTKPSAIPVNEGYSMDYKTEATSYVPHEIQPQQQMKQVLKSAITLSDGHSTMPQSSTREMLDQSKGPKVEQVGQNKMLLNSSINLKDDDKFRDESEMKGNFRQHVDVKPAEIYRPNLGKSSEHVCNPEKDEPMISEARANFVKREIVPNKEMALIQQKMTRATDPNSQTLSLDKFSFETTHGKTYNPSTYKIEPNVDALNNKSKHSQNHINMQFEPQLDPHTTATTDALKHTAQHAATFEQPQMNTQNRKGNIVYDSGEKHTYETEARANFIPHGVVCEQVGMDKLNELRKSHYSLGHDKTEIVSEMRDQFKHHDEYRDDGKYLGQKKGAGETVFM